MLSNSMVLALQGQPGKLERMEGFLNEEAT